MKVWKTERIGNKYKIELRKEALFLSLFEQPLRF